MKWVRLIAVAAAAALLVAPAGCARSKYVPVSGVVKVNGQPYKNAVVTFQPLGTAQNPEPGQGSSALTDEYGRYTLMTNDGQPGAIVGKHRVRIQTKRDDPTAYFDPATGSPDDPAHQAKKPKIDPIPLEWYSDQSTKEFDVPPGGTDQANFDIQSKPAGGH